VKSAKLKLLIFFLILEASACKGQSTGVAPSDGSTNNTPDVTNDSASYIKNGETITIASGWKISLDTADSVETTVLANGWTVEVLSE
jgi:hypothetical protein